MEIVGKYLIRNLTTRSAPWVCIYTNETKHRERGALAEWRWALTHLHTVLSPWQIVGSAAAAAASVLDFYVARAARKLAARSTRGQAVGNNKNEMQREGGWPGPGEGAESAALGETSGVYKSGISPSVDMSGSFFFTA